MPRIYNVRIAGADELMKRVERQFDDPAFQTLRSQLLTTIQDHGIAVEEGSPAAFTSIERLLLHYESLIPTRPGCRFAIDAWIINDIATSWSRGAVKLPQTIIPLYGSEWTWQKLPWFAEQHQQGHEVFGLKLKGVDQLNSVHLLEYPWLCHELGHGLFHKCTRPFLDQFASRVEQSCSPLLKKSFSDSSETRAVTMSYVEGIRKAWLPRQDQQSWIHEFAVDAFALWSCGPAFLSAMHDSVDDPSLDPFIIRNAHPPYALRIKILVSCANRLNWTTYATPLAKLLTKWNQKIPFHYNKYSALASEELSACALDWALAACREWNIPLCNQESLKSVEKRRRANEPIESAIELILSAWYCFEQDSGHYTKWEGRIINEWALELCSNSGNSIGP